MDQKVNFERLDSEIIEKTQSFSSATLHEAAGKKGALPSEIKPVSQHNKICGQVITVCSPAYDNIMLHQAIYAAKPGDILIVDVSGGYEAGYWGDVMTHAALQRGIRGLVINGCVRDIDDLDELKFPVFARGLCIRGTSKNGGGAINHPIKIGDVNISPGDFIVGDRDGVVILPQEEIREILLKAEKRVETEERIKEELADGRTTIEIYGWQEKY